MDTSSPDPQSAPDPIPDGVPPSVGIAAIWDEAERLADADPSAALRLLEHATVRAERIGDRRAVAECRERIGTLHRRHGRLADAVREWEEASRLFLLEGDSVRLAGIRRNLGFAYSDLGRYDLAIAHYLESLRSAEESGTGDLARIYNDLGVAYHRLFRYDTALEYYRKAQHRAAEEGMEDATGGLLNNIGSIYSRLGRYDEALEIHTEALAIWETLGDRRGIAISLGSIGVLHALRRDAVGAIEHYERSLAIREELNDRSGMAILHRNISSVLRGSGLHEEALQHIERAIALARDLDARDLLWQFHEECSILHEEMGEFRMALEHHKLFSEYRGQTLDAEKQRTIAELQAKYDLERTTSEREQFRRRMLEWEHKAFRAQINPHFLFNALNSIQYFLVEHDTESAARYLSRFARLMRLALDNSRSTLIPLQSELECLELYLALESLRFGDRLAYDISVDEQTDPGELNVPPMILQPYVENAIWHGILPLSRPGHVRIRVRCDASDRLLCSIEDDGVGRGAGHDSGSERRHSSGMTMIEERLVLLEQTTGLPCHVRVIDLVDAEGRPLGTRVELDLPAGLLPGDP